MKRRQLAGYVSAITLVALVLGTVIVLAAPPEDIFPTLINAFITNTNADPVPVDITDATLDVNLDEPIEMTNPPGEALKTDVSGWLHTTRGGHTDIVVITPNSTHTILNIDTEGYRTITVNTIVWNGSAADFEVKCWLQGGASFTVDTYWLPPLMFEGHVETYEIRSPSMTILARATSTHVNSGVILSYYMTT